MHSALIALSIFSAAPPNAVEDMRLRERDDELIAAREGYRIGLPDHAPRAGGYFLQQLIARMMAGAVVDFLEAVQIGERDRRTRLIAQ